MEFVNDSIEPLTSWTRMTRGPVSEQTRSRLEWMRPRVTLNQAAA
jgi:hypothetical protein